MCARERVALTSEIEYQIICLCLDENYQENATIIRTILTKVGLYVLGSQ